MDNKEKCPVCGNEEYVSVDVGGSGEYPPYLYAYGQGHVDLVGCTSCGVVRLSKRTLRRLEQDTSK